MVDDCLLSLGPMVELTWRALGCCLARIIMGEDEGEEEDLLFFSLSAELTS